MENSVSTLNSVLGNKEITFFLSIICENWSLHNRLVPILYSKNLLIKHLLNISSLTSTEYSCYCWGNLALF